MQKKWVVDFFWKLINGRHSSNFITFLRATYFPGSFFYGNIDAVDTKIRMLEKLVNPVLEIWVFMHEACRGLFGCTMAKSHVKKIDSRAEIRGQPNCGHGQLCVLKCG